MCSCVWSECARARARGTVCLFVCVSGCIIALMRWLLHRIFLVNMANILTNNIFTINQPTNKQIIESINKQNKHLTQKEIKNKKDGINNTKNKWVSFWSCTLTSRLLMLTLFTCELTSHSYGYETCVIWEESHISLSLL